MKMKTKGKILTAISVFLCAAVLFCSCGGSAAYTLETVALGENVQIHTDLQTEYLAGDYTDIAKYAKGREELSYPQPVRFEWQAALPAGKKGAEIKQYIVEISLRQDFSDAVRYQTAAAELDVYNLRIAAEYYWRVTAELANGEKIVSSESRFTTSGAAPRNLCIEGVTNVRDLGGWETPSGRVKQGMIYRCGRLNESETTEVNIEITPLGIETMRSVLGIRSEIDLRVPDAHNTETGGITSSPLGEDVTYFNCPLEWDQGNYLTDNVSAVKEFFAFIADGSHYPIIYHCNIGTDRTGLFAFLINGLLGVCEEDLYRDYLFSNFGKINVARTIYNIKNSYVATVKQYEGDTLSEKIENCLLALGIEQAHIDAVRKIMTAE